MKRQFVLPSLLGAMLMACLVLLLSTSFRTMGRPRLEAERHNAHARGAATTAVPPMLSIASRGPSEDEQVTTRTTIHWGSIAGVLAVAWLLCMPVCAVGHGLRRRDGEFAGPRSAGWRTRRRRWGTCWRAASSSPWSAHVRCGPCSPAARDRWRISSSAVLHAPDDPRRADDGDRHDRPPLAAPAAGLCSEGLPSNCAGAGGCAGVAGRQDIAVECAAMRLDELAQEIEAEVVGDGSIDVSAVNTLDAAQAGQVSFLVQPAVRQAARDDAGVGRDRCSPGMKTAASAPCCAPRTPTSPLPRRWSGCTATAATRSRACTRRRTWTRRASVGENTVVYPGAYIGPNARLGRDCIIYPNVTIYDGCVLGDRVIIQAGAVIGADGYGFATPRRRSPQDSAGRERRDRG